MFSDTRVKNNQIFDIGFFHTFFLPLTFCFGGGLILLEKKIASDFHELRLKLQPKYSKIGFDRGRDAKDNFFRMDKCNVIWIERGVASDIHWKHSKLTSSVLPLEAIPKNGEKAVESPLKDNSLSDFAMSINHIDWGIEIGVFEERLSMLSRLELLRFLGEPMIAATSGVACSLEIYPTPIVTSLRGL